MMIVLSIIFELFSDLMGNFDHKLAIQIQFLSQRACKILRGVIWVINVPFESILQANIVYFDVQLQNSKTLLLFGSKCSVMAYGLLYGIDYLGFKWHQKSIFSNEQFDILFRSEIRLIGVPAKHLLILFTIRLKFQVNWYQIFLHLQGPFPPDVQCIWDQVKLLIDCFIKSSITWTPRIEALQPIGQISLYINIISFN